MASLVWYAKGIKREHGVTITLRGSVGTSLCMACGGVVICGISRKALCRFSSILASRHRCRGLLAEV